MNKETIFKAIGTVAKNIGTGVSKHSPEILTGIGIAGMITTTILAVNATPKAMKLIDEKKEELKTDKLPAKETVKATWKCYIPAAISCAASISCIIGANTVHAKRNAALATAYKLSETALNEYKDKVVEKIGVKKEQEIRDDINKDRIDNNPVTKTEVIVTGAGETLCYDVISDRYFKSDIETIRRIENRLNKRMISEMYISLSEFYDELGLKHTKNSDDIGWNLNQDGFIDLHFSSQLSDDGRPCLVIDYSVAPRYEFQSLY